MEGPSEEHESSAMACLTRTPPDASPSRPIFMPRVRITVRLARVTASRAAATTSLNFNLESTPKLRASGAKFLSMPWEGRRGKAELSKLRIAVLRRSISAAYSSAKLPIAALRRSISDAHWLCSARRSSTESCRAAARSELASSSMASSSLFQFSEAALIILSLMARPPLRTADFCQGMWRTWERQTAVWTISEKVLETSSHRHFVKWIGCIATSLNSATDFSSRLAAKRNLGRRPFLLPPELLLARIEAERVVLRQHVEPVRQAQSLGGRRRPIGIAQHLARDRDDIGLTVLQDRLGLRRLGDHADNHGRDIGFAAHVLGIDDVVSGQIAWHRRQIGRAFEPAA